MPVKTKKIRSIFIIYWVLLAYIISALIWWFIALNRQNYKMTQLKLQENKIPTEEIMAAEKRKTTQYIGEGSIFFLLIAAGAVFVFRSVRRQLKQSQDQQNFMVAITHELKTPIAVAKLNLETLQKRKLDDTQQRRLIYNTLQEANRLNALCNNLLLSSQMEAGGYNITFEETDFSQLVRDCVNDFITRFPHRTINLSVKEDLFINGDRLLLQMAVNNLADNAIKYSSKESAVTIELNETNNLIQLLVMDEGKGIVTEEKQKIFDKFYRTGNASTRGAKGTGLGLFLTKKIVEQHNGNISVTDNEPNGSIFAIQLKPADSYN